ncbi:response regulator NasT [Jannaschia seohaensis]|uniref:Response regulator NasT n=2 Tax=Jannaschia seohaensis TaxID=475081 RepID=A0A2Y9B8G1_9RHOB|nr:response regulator NasT [Jannaschia seohaensis]SSA51768.1 response regulator NasT [Jannaschia seohaensis]
MDDTDQFRGSGGGGRALRVLIVEDDALIAMDAELMLLDAGQHVVGIAAEEDEAVRMALIHRPDVILLDLRLAKGGCGRRVAERLAGEVDVSIIFASGNLTPVMRERLAALSPAGMLGKPYGPDQLIGAIHELA